MLLSLLLAESGSLGIGVVFWILFIIGLVVYGWDSYRVRTLAPASVFWWVLLFLLGCGVFGFPIKF